MAKILYFGTLADMLQKESEVLSLPVEVTNVSQLLVYLRQRGGDWSMYLQDDKLQITVNRQFTTLTHQIGNQDEIGFIPQARRM